jgi:S-adenosylmethionine hydrolase
MGLTFGDFGNLSTNIKNKYISKFKYITTKRLGITLRKNIKRGKTYPYRTKNNQKIITKFSRFRRKHKK